MQRIAVVTGASSGIGEATARALAAGGWHCVLVARREDRLRVLAEEIGGEVELCDVGDRAAVEALAARVLERHPAIHLLVNNAGMPARGTYLKVDPDLVERVMRVNYLGGVWCARAFMPGLEAAARVLEEALTISLQCRLRYLLVGVYAQQGRSRDADRQAAAAEGCRDAR